ncbi:MAG: sensor histidine kinase [Streptosporangiaceae bacterium]
MSDTAMIPDRQGERSPVRWSASGGIIAGCRGLALAGLMLAGLSLLLVPVIAVFLTALGAGVLIVGNGAPRDHRIVLGLTALAAGLLIVRFLVPAALLGLRRVTSLTRRLAGEWSGVEIAVPYQPPASDRAKLPFRARLLWLVSDPATWRDLLWVAVNATVGWLIALLPAVLAGIGLIAFIYPAARPDAGVAPPAFPGNSRTALLAIGIAFVLAGVAAAQWLLRAYFGLARSMLAPTGQAELALRVHHLAQTRSETLDSGAAEIRRIERDLHDGAQARLVALGMNLRAVERILPASPEAALALVAEARETSVRALNDLRDLIRGICPPVLADRGLGHAVRALALDTPLPVVLDISLPGRLSAPVESACYFAVAEVLANAVKHSGARLVHLRIQHSGSVLRIEVSDDGVGGADPANGTGLRGVERRLGTFDGILAVNSPTGGPTMIVMEVPCALLSPKTCSC